MIYTDLKYPLGKYSRPEMADQENIDKQINEIFMFPERILWLIDDIPAKMLDRTYREDSWNVRQLIHHCADSHMNAFIRFKLCLTEENPTIKPYLEAEWAKGPDYKASISPSIQLIKGIHRRWCGLMKSLTMEDWNRTYYHPEDKIEYKLYEVVALYAWHSNHHLAHMEIALHE